MINDDDNDDNDDDDDDDDIMILITVLVWKYSCDCFIGSFIEPCSILASRSCGYKKF